jgi:DNA repair exonuclease SbcCD nuclease subunit
MTFKKIALFTDHHLGCKNNSAVHNQDCVDYINWFCDEIVAKDPEITHIGFLGDWYENRSSISISTIAASYQALKKLNSMGLPVLFCVGNHDLYYRHTRQIHSVDMFNEFSNFQVFENITTINNSIWCPFLFPAEYAELAARIEKEQPEYVFGHFEFNGFVLSGSSNISASRMEHGADPKDFSKPKRVLSGHFHKRQLEGNITYIGNTFPTNFGDSGDSKRGCAVLDTRDNNIEFHDWADCPTYLKTTLTAILNGTAKLQAKSYVTVSVDQEFSYSQAQELKDELIKEYNLREFKLDEATKAVVTEAALSEEDITESMSIDEIVIDSIEKMEFTGNIKPGTLSNMYSSLKTGK